MCCCSGSGYGGRGGCGVCVESSLFEFITVTFSAFGRNHFVSIREATEVYVCGVLCFLHSLHCGHPSLLHNRKFTHSVEELDLHLGLLGTRTA